MVRQQQRTIHQIPSVRFKKTENPDTKARSWEKGTCGGGGVGVATSITSRYYNRNGIRLGDVQLFFGSANFNQATLLTARERERNAHRVESYSEGVRKRRIHCRGERAQPQNAELRGLRGGGNVKKGG